MAEKMKRYLRPILLFLLVSLSFFFPLDLPGIERLGLKYIRNYDYKEYGIHPQNWGIVQDKQGIIYVANNGGILEYDGTRWRLIEVDNPPVRSIAVTPGGKIYAGSTGDIGFLTPGEDGKLEYRSLLSHLDNQDITFTDVWMTRCIGEQVFFSSYEYLFRWDSKKLKTWGPQPLKKRFYASFVQEDTFYIRMDNTGLLKLERDTLHPVPGGQLFAKEKIAMMVPYDPAKGTLLIGTRANRFFIYDGRTFTPFPTEVDAYLKKSRMYRGIRLSGGDFAIATLKGGMVIISPRGRLKYLFNERTGLQINGVKDLLEDYQGNIWLALSKGVTRFEYPSPFFHQDIRIGLPGTVLAVIRYGRDLYAGSDLGMFVLPASAGSIQQVPGAPVSCRAFLRSGDFLLAATDAGVLIVDPREKKITQHFIRGVRTFALCKSRRYPNRVWVGTRFGPATLTGFGNNWEEERFFDTAKYMVNTVAEDNRGNPWLGGGNGKVTRLVFTGGNPAPEVQKYGAGHGLPKEGEINVYYAAGHVVFTTIHGVFRFHEEQNTFVPDPLLGETFLHNKEQVFLIKEEPEKGIWFHSLSRNYLASTGKEGRVGLFSQPFLRIPKAQVNAIYPDPSRKAVWFAGVDGLIRYDTSMTDEPVTGFSTLIREITCHKAFTVPIKNPPAAAGKSVFPQFPYKHRSFTFTCAAPYFTDETATRFSYFLEGYDAGWSPWTEAHFIDYTNLEAGAYTFRARAKNVYGVNGREARYTFKILPPWYQTWWAYLLYVLLLAAVIFFVVKWRSHQLLKEKLKLEGLVKDRTREVNRKNLQLEEQTGMLLEQAEKLKEMDRIKSRFFANISHEFRTPLTLITGPLEHLLSKNTPREEGETKEMQVMLENSRRLLRLINQLLDLARLDSGKVELRVKKQDMVRFLKGICASFRVMAELHQIALEFNSGEKELFLSFDAEKMEEVVCNLLSNAVKFTPPPGTITVSLRAAPAEDREDRETGEKRFLDISVKDTGIGIPREQIPHVFDRFYQAGGNNNQHNKQKGTGIGLALTRELVTLHGGSIDLHSVEGEGTEFVIHLPTGPKHPEAEEIPAAPGEEPAAGLENRMAGLAPVEEQKEKGAKHDTEVLEEAVSQQRQVILVVEDNPDMRAFIKRSLEPFYSVIEAADGAEGIEKAGEHIPDLVVSDVMMPEADGYELCHTLKENVKTSHIPVILLTAKASDESRLEGLKTGADDYVSKPFNTHLLLARIENLIDLRRQLQEKIQRQLRLEPGEIAVPSIEETFLKELQEVIEKHLSDPGFNVEKLSKKLYMGRNTLYRKVMALTGEPPNHFIRSYRLKRAAQLLEAHFGNVTEVAMEVGFSSNAHFTKCFKEKFHRLPSTYQDVNK